MNFLTRKKCLEIGKKHRWEYLKIVVKYLKIINFNSCLELGCGIIPIVLDGDTMDKNDLPNLTYHWNSFKTPWPIKDKQYDMFVALQVWEHLKGKQNLIFQEVNRIANWAILSFPYKWSTKGFHGGITKSVIANWTYPYKSFIKPRIIRKRIIYVFKFSKDTKDDKYIKKLMEKI